MIVIHGHMRTGKTLNAEAFAKVYGCPRIYGDWPFGGHRPGKPEQGHLVLTTESPARIAKMLSGATIIPINAARARIGLGPAPERGFP